VRWDVHVAHLKSNVKFYLEIAEEEMRMRALGIGRT
jgi:hypothetical protein